MDGWQALVAVFQQTVIPLVEALNTLVSVFTGTSLGELFTAVIESIQIIVNLR